MSPEAPSHARAAAPNHPRNLIVLRAGDESLHAHWTRGAERGFDIFVSYYGDAPGRHLDDADYYEARPGPKWPALAAVLRENPALLDAYDAFWFPDDDLAADTDVIDRMFAFFHAHQLALAQPALTCDSYFTWSTLLQQPRFTGFVEVMAPIFSRAALRACAATFDESRSGWGLDWAWPIVCERAGLDRIAVIDATPVRHTRPVGGELHPRHPEMSPRGDAERVLQKYGLHEVRAVPKYSFGSQVVESALPAWRRLMFWMKRVHGRRKHALKA